MVRPAGFEPATHSLEGCCSIQLSYERIEGKYIHLNNIIYTNFCQIDSLIGQPI